MPEAFSTLGIWHLLGFHSRDNWKNKSFYYLLLHASVDYLWTTLCGPKDYQQLFGNDCSEAVSAFCHLYAPCAVRTGLWCRSGYRENALALLNTANTLVCTETRAYGRHSPAYSTGICILWKYIGMEELHRAAELCNAIVSHLSQYAIPPGQKVNDPAPIVQFEQKQAPFNIQPLTAQMHFGHCSNSHCSLLAFLSPLCLPA